MTAVRGRWAALGFASIVIFAQRTARADEPMVWDDNCAVDLLAPHAMRCLSRRLVPERVAAGRRMARALATDAGSTVGTCDGKAPSSLPLPPIGLGATDLAKAYAIPATPTGAGKVVAIVDACANKTVVSDLAAYRKQYGLPALPECGGGDGHAPTAGGAACIGVVSQTGDAKIPASDSGWAGEIALDVEMVSAACPACSILLVEADSPNSPDLAVAEDYAASLKVDAISNSFGGWEDPNDPGGPSQSDGAFASAWEHPGILITVASGDQNYLDQGLASQNNNVPPNAPNFPASIPSVLCVGGTTLAPASGSARGFSEVVWNDSATLGGGSGCSTEFATPAYQSKLDMGSCKMRGSVDVSAAAQYNDGNPFGGGIAVYLGGGWSPVTGTSASSPFVAALLTRVGLAHEANDFFYAHPSAFYDVTSGNNDPSKKCNDVMCNAGPGWDGPTGWGSPNGAALASLSAGGTDAGTAEDAGAVDSGSGGGVDSGSGSGGVDSGSGGGVDSGGVDSGDDDGGSSSGGIDSGSGGGGIDSGSGSGGVDSGSGSGSSGGAHDSGVARDSGAAGGSSGGNGDTGGGDGSGDSSGCGCATPGSQAPLAPAGVALAMLGAVVASAARRRRR